MAAISEKKEIAAAVGGVLTVDAEQLGRDDRMEFTTEEMAARISESADDVAEALERIAETDGFPLVDNGDSWIIER